MKTITLLWVLSSIHLVALCQKNAGFVIDGKFNGLPDGSKLYLTTQENDTVASAISKGDRFIFKGSLPLEGRFHFIKFDTNITRVNAGPILVVNKPMKVSGVIGERNPTVKGSPYHEDYFAWRKLTEPFLKKEKDIHAVIASLSQFYFPEVNGKDPVPDSLQGIAFRKEEAKKYQEIDSLRYACFDAFLQWLSKHHKSLAIPWDLKAYARVPEFADRVEEAFNTLSPAAQASYYGVETRRNLNGARAAKTLQQGKIIPDFTLTTLDGKKMSVLDIAAKHKYTLIDVWASWCSPCRSSIPALKEDYQLFKNKGFNILALSVDSKEDQWRKAVEVDDTPWTHVRDTEKEAKSIFGFDAIPVYILIDQKGKMIALDMLTNVTPFGGSLRGEQLRKQLEKLFIN